MRRAPKGAVAVTPASLLARLPRAPSVEARCRQVVVRARRLGSAAAAHGWPVLVGVASLCAGSLAALTRLLAYSLLMLASAAVYSVRVLWADRFLAIAPLLALWRQRSRAIVPVRVGRRAADDAAAFAAHYRATAALYLGSGLLAALLGWIVAHAS